jgi:DNA polymerase-3 subunit epsilon
MANRYTPPVSSNGTLALRIARRHIGTLPQAPGVYLFYGSAGELLYVGKSRDVRTRVRAHFSAPDEAALCRQVQLIEARETAGELGALLLESQLIKELRPVYNVRSRQRRRIVVARRVMKRAGYLSVVLDAIDSIDFRQTSPYMAIFKTRKQAKEYLVKVAKTYRLCPKLLQLEATRRHCFSYHLGQCSGACMGLEDPILYNTRFEEAFAERRIKAWPFNGGVIIEERGKDNTKGEVFLVDNWCLLYSFKYSLDRFELNVRGTHRFDYDSYRILCRYIFDAANQENIRYVSRGEFDAFVRKAMAAGDV